MHKKYIETPESFNHKKVVKNLIIDAAKNHFSPEKILNNNFDDSPELKALSVAEGKKLEMELNPLLREFRVAESDHEKIQICTQLVLLLTILSNPRFSQDLEIFKPQDIAVELKRIKVILQHLLNKEPA
jgi:hypothetical protein